MRMYSCKCMKFLRTNTILLTWMILLEVCLPFSVVRLARASHHHRLPSRLFDAKGADPWEAVRIEVPENLGDVTYWLVQKGFHFDSYRRRLDFCGGEGIWVRDSSQSIGVVEYLQAHQQEYNGLTRDEAQAQADRPYSQQFQREKVTSDGIIFGIIVDGGRRNTTYHLGDWNETVPAGFNSAIFRDGESLKRRTYWKDSKHITETITADRSKDTTFRYLEQDKLVVERVYQHSKSDELVACKELFIPKYPNNSSVAMTSLLTRVPGCVANVDIKTTLVKDGDLYRFMLDGEADAMISRGLLAILSQAVYQMDVNVFLALDPCRVADHLGLRHALTTGRNDGLASMTRTAQSMIRAMLSGVKEEHLPNVTASTRTKPTVAVLLSGGVDSSVALNLLKRQGYVVTAFYLKIWLEDELSHLGQCPWEDDYRMCEAICAQAGVPLEAISLQEQYKERVISYTVAEANRGRTPNPDIMCNSRVKFGCFYDAIEGRGFDHVASGHYAQLVSDEGTGLMKLLRAPDPIKDQSYFLCALSQQQLQKVLFPIGHLQKAEVRELAEEFNLPNKSRPDSQGLCFLGKVKFHEFLGAYLGERPGDIVDAATGEILGRHKGVWYHTVGQRKGIGKVLNPKATSRGPWYVVSKDPANNIVYTSNEYEEEIFAAARTNVFIEDIHWIAGQPPPLLIGDGGSFRSGRLQMKIRHGPKLVDGSLLLSSADAGSVELDDKDGGLAPGQFVVIYEVDRLECLGGGVISERHWAKFLMDRKETVIETVAQ